MRCIVSMEEYSSHGHLHQCNVQFTVLHEFHLLTLLFTPCMLMMGGIEGGSDGCSPGPG